jgi:histidinol-phosphate aminotransferase
LRTAIAATENLSADCVFCGNGSDEVLAFTFYAFFDDDLPLLFPDITYSFYPVYAKLYAIPTRTVPLNENFQVNIGDYFQPAGGVIIPNPNAPTGIYLESGSICELLDHHSNKVVVIDEAYIAFGGQSAAALIEKYPNLLVVRTFSKSHSLAGLRVGYALGQPHLIEGLARVKDSFNSYPVDRIAAEIAKAAILDQAYYAEINRKVIATRERFSEAMTKLGFKVLPSRANFVFASHANRRAEDLFAQLKDRGVLVRYFNKPRIDNYLRITIGTDEDMDKCIDIIGGLVQ